MCVKFELARSFSTLSISKTDALQTFVDFLRGYHVMISVIYGLDRRHHTRVSSKQERGEGRCKMSKVLIEILQWKATL